jgi:CHAD domain-containing protein
LRQLTDALKDALMRCAHDPDVDAVHDARTGTRRIEAVLEAALRSASAQAGEGEDPRMVAVRAWERLLKRVRRAAAPARDLDVQRKLLRKLVPELNDVAEQMKGGRAGAAAKLDRALLEERAERAAPPKKNAVKWAEKLEEHFAAFADATRRKQANRRRKVDAAKLALDAFARLSTRMLRLDEGNLHDFRKGAKKARYMAEAEAGNEHAGAVGKALKRLQDAIGDWHDWLMLADEAGKHLGDDDAPLKAQIGRERDEHFAAALKVSAKMRGKLMGERLAMERSSGGARGRVAAARSGARMRAAVQAVKREKG